MESGAKVRANFRQGLEDLCGDGADATVRRLGDCHESGSSFLPSFSRKVGSKMPSLRGSVWEMGFEERGEGKKSHPVELFPNFDIFLSILMNLLC